MATVTSSILSRIEKKVEQGPRGFPGPAGPVTGGVYPGAGIPLSTGSAWGTSITNNSTNWNTAYGWGDHSAAGYAPTANPTFTGLAKFINSVNGETIPLLAENSYPGTSIQASYGFAFNTAATDPDYLGKIAVNISDRGDGTQASEMSFYTSRAGILTESIKIDTGGLKVYVGTTDDAGATWYHSGTTAFAHLGIVNPGVDNNTQFGTVSNNDLLFLANNIAWAKVATTGELQEPNFISGWQGNNWQIQADGDAEFNNVLIRGGLSVFELIINQLHYQNGGLIIGAGAGKIDAISDDTVGTEIMTFHDPEGNDIVPFTEGAIVMVQRVDINRTDVVKKIVRQVDDITGMVVTLGVTTGWTTGDDTGIFEVGDEVVAIGHISDTDLDSCLYMSAIDSGNPFLRVMDGVSSYSKWSLGDKTTVKLQIGNLASLDSYDIVPASPGYGLYSDNVYLKGLIQATSGLIGGFTINSTEGLYSGTGATRVQMKPGAGFWAGATAFGDAPFSVDEAGSLTATGVVELGTNPVSLGGASLGLAIQGGEIWETNYNGDTGGIHLNRVGYQGGATKYRDVVIYDGKGNILLKVDAANDVIYLLAGEIQASGNIYSQQTIQINPSASPPLTEEGVIYADTDHHLYYYNGSAWKQLDN